MEESARRKESGDGGRMSEQCVYQGAGRRAWRERGRAARGALR